MKTLPLVFAVVTALLPVVTQKTGLSAKHGFGMKMLCAAMYIVTGVISALSLYRATAYSVMILAALVLGILGDFFLEYKSKKLFPLGAAFFGTGHLVYSGTFLFVGAYKASEHIGAVALITVLLSAVTLIFAGVKLRLTGKKKLLLLYAPVLFFAFACAVVCGTAAKNEGNLSFALCLISGGVLFLLSDIMIGMGKGGIKRPVFLHNAVSYTYFAAQAFFALSIYFQ